MRWIYEKSWWIFDFIPSFNNPLLKIQTSCMNFDLINARLLAPGRRKNLTGLADLHNPPLMAVLFLFATCLFQSNQKLTPRMKFRYQKCKEQHAITVGQNMQNYFNSLNQSNSQAGLELWKSGLLKQWMKSFFVIVIIENYCWE